MMVIFTSRSEKKAIYSTRRILDAFADRIGNDTWQTVITEDGLSTVKSLLRKHATKSTAVSCHWIRARNRSDLIWIVGNRDKFNAEGIVPVNTTQKNIQHNEWENNWIYLQKIKALTAMAALLHDWGKANDHFQQKLRNAENIADRFRHEWLSCCLIAGVVANTKNRQDDTEWLQRFIEGNFDKNEVLQATETLQSSFLNDLPPVASLICWLILSHHRLPISLKKENQFSSQEKNSFKEVMAIITAEWGYQNENCADNVKFSAGLLKNANQWMNCVQKWAAVLLHEKESLINMIHDKKLRPVLNYARISLMLGDYYVSSQESTRGEWQEKLYANTNGMALKQKLDEHLVRVAAQAIKIARKLPYLAEKMEAAHDIKTLKKKSIPQFAWQDLAVEKIKSFRKAKEAEISSCGWFIVNMASTGCGKTIANAKIMQAISEDGDSLRYILALGLRSLTLQTGDEYRNRIGLNRDEMAVLIGSAAVRELHEKDHAIGADSGDSQTQEELLDSELDYQVTYMDDFLDIFFDKNETYAATKNKAFLYKPVLVATIDHMMPGVETTKGGRYILPFLRLMSSDLVIDEIDDFDKKDLMAISRLIHLAGMLGRNVVISSATIPPDLAKGLFSAYQEGRSCYKDFLAPQDKVVCVWCDEYKTKVTLVANAEYQAQHITFVDQRAIKLQQQIVKQKAFLVDCSAIIRQEQDQKETMYFDKIKETAESLHELHNVVEQISGKRISFGLVRTANIRQCVALSEFLLKADWKKNYAPKIMVYHSRQTLLLRHEQEKYLDTVLKRKGMSQKSVIIKDDILRRHIDSMQEDNLLFIVAATPVEEVGRDHDFDWAIVEPSSYRSLIQLAGRILRHHILTADIAVPNIAIMQYNLRGLQNDNKPAFCKPGYETSKKYSLPSHDMKVLVDEKQLQKGINAIPRIIKPANMDEVNLRQLEHSVMYDFQDMTLVGPENLHGWLREYWWLTGLPQQLNHFRDGVPEMKLYLLYRGEEIDFYEKPARINEPIKTIHYIVTREELNRDEKNRLWLNRDYETALRKWAKKISPDAEEAESMEKISEKFGEISVAAPTENNSQTIVKQYFYSDQLGMFTKI